MKKLRHQIIKGLCIGASITAILFLATDISKLGIYAIILFQIAILIATTQDIN